jgi:TonB-linked SusC/RagA family outer membrane protein
MQPMLMLLRSWRPFELLPVLILSLTCLCATAHAHAQNDHPVTLVGNGITLRTVFKAIKRQTGFAVMYSTQATALNQDEKVNVNFKNTPLDDVLAYVLRGKELDWKYNDDVLIIHKKDPAPAEKKIEADSTVTPAMITGKITDGTGTALPGVTVQVKGTTQGTTTDENGNFSLPRVSIGSTLLMTSVGYEKREIVVNGKKILIQLNAQALQLDEGVAIAYGTTTQRLSTGNIATVKAKDIERQPVANPLLALQGRVPGLFITQNTGISGGALTVRIQGQNSIQSGNDPLYVIDGVPIASQLLATGFGLDGILGTADVALGAAPAAGNPLSYLNPADIESITVLKDADATAIYGSRAANGAILITTKKGKVGPVKLDLNLQQGWGQVTREIKMLNTQQYLQMRHEAFKNDGITNIPATSYDLTLWDTSRYTNWQKTLIGNTAQYTNLSGSISGGTDLLQYAVGGTYHRETTVFPLPSNFADQKAAFHFSMNSTSANRKFNMQFTGNYMIDHNRLPPIDLTPIAITLEPDAPALYQADGSLNWELTSTGSGTWNNPLSAKYQEYTNKTNSLVANLVLAYYILPNLQIKSSLGYINLYTSDFSTTGLLATPPQLRPYIQNYAYYGNRNMNSWIMEPQLNYSRQLWMGNLELLLGGSVQQSTSTSQNIQGVGYSTDQVLRDIKAATSLIINGSNFIQYKYNAFFGRLNYDWRNKYILNLTARRDGSARFGRENKLHTFGAVGAAWIFSEEPLVKRWRQALSFGKLRLSYGITGNDQLVDYNYLNLYSQTFTPQLYQGAAGLQPQGLPNPYLQWEMTKKWQTGLELGFIKDRILLYITYARNRSSNQLVSYSLPSTTGFDHITQNLPATVQNTSWEFALSTNNFDKSNFRWTTQINLTIPRNMLLSYPDLSASSYASTYIIGQPLSVVRIFSYGGVDPETGLYRAIDKNGKFTTTPAYPDDYAILKNPFPKFYGGLQNNIRYKDFTLDFLFQYVQQQGPQFIFNNGSALPPGAFISGVSNQPATVLDRWQSPGDNATVMRYTTDIYGTGALKRLAISSNANYGDASYLRLKNISLSWETPVAWANTLHGRYFRIYAQAQNLLTFTPYKGLDPETQNINSLPPLRVITIGIQAGF